MHATAVVLRVKNARMRIRFDLTFILAVLVGLNLHLAGMGNPQPWIFFPAPVLAGQWWRLLTHPFVHVSLYHLLLDAGAFLILYCGIDYRSSTAKAAAASVCAASGLTAAWLSDAPIDTLGMCGLSATAHGLMALTALQRIDRGEESAAGIVSLVLVAAKSTAEAVTGQVMFDFVHMDLCGSPLAVCHLGGVLGGVGVFLTGKLIGLFPASARGSIRCSR